MICLDYLLSLQAASFNCAKSVTRMEKLICSDEKLSKMDKDLLVLYSKSLHEATNPETTRKQQRTNSSQSALIRAREQFLLILA